MASTLKSKFYLLPKNIWNIFEQKKNWSKFVLIEWGAHSTIIWGAAAWLSALQVFVFVDSSINQKLTQMEKNWITFILIGRRTVSGKLILAAENQCDPMVTFFAQICPFSPTEVVPCSIKIAQVGSKFCPVLNNLAKIAKDFQR